MKTVTLIATEYGTENHGLNNSVIALDITIENDAWYSENRRLTRPWLPAN